MSKYISKKTEIAFLLRVNVKPNSKIQTIDEDDEFLTISLKSKPIQNRANKELLKLLKSKLKGLNIEEIRIISGLKSSTKRIELVFSKDIEDKIIIQRLRS